MSDSSTTSISFERAADYYDQTRPLTDEARDAMTDLLSRQIGDREPTLEIGVGTGLVALPLHRAGVRIVGLDLSRAMVDKLVEASRLLDDVYWRQSDVAGLALYQSTRDPALKRLLMIMGSRWDLIDENRPFVGTGTPEIVI